MSEVQEQAEKGLKSIINTTGRKNSQRSVSFRGIQLEVLPQYPETVDKPQKVGLFGIVRLLKQKTQRLIGPCFNKIRQAADTERGKYSSQNTNCLNMFFRLMTIKRLSNGFNSICTQSLGTIVASEVVQKPRSQLEKHGSLQVIKRMPTFQKSHHTHSQRSLISRSSFRSNDTHSVKSNDQVLTRQQSERMMCLGEQAKQALISMQRFDRFIYVMESEKRLKAPIQSQLRRLEKIKNQYRCMRDSYFDNELTITCLYNHMKNLYEMNRDLGKIVQLKAQIQKLEQRIIENNVKHTAALKEANTSTKGKLAEDAALLKEYLKTNEVLIEILKDKSNPERIKRQLENLIKKTPQDRREMLCLIQAIVPTEIRELDGMAVIYDTHIGRILEPQMSSDKNIKYLEKMKKSLEKSMEETQNQEQKHAYQQLSVLSCQLMNLHTQSKSKGESEIVTAQLNRLRMEIQNSTRRFKQLQARSNTLKELESTIKNLDQIATSISVKVTSEENYLSQIVRHKKMLTSRRNVPVVKVFVDTLNMLEILAKKDKKKDIQAIESKLKDMESANSKLVEQLQVIRTNQETNQLIKLLKIFPAQVQVSQLAKVKRYIEINRKKLPSYSCLLSTLQYLINSLSQQDREKGKSLSNSNRIEQSKQRELANIESLMESMLKMLEEKNFNVAKLRKNLETNIRKSQGTACQYEFQSVYLHSLKLLQTLSGYLQSQQGQKLVGEDRLKKDLQNTRSAHLQELREVTKLKDKEIESLKEQALSRDRIVTDLQNEINNKEGLIKTLQTGSFSLDTMKQQLALVKRQLEQSKLDNKKMDAHSQQLRVQISQLQLGNQSLTSQLNIMQEQLQSQQLKNQQLQDTNQVSIRQNDQFKLSNQSITNQLNQSQGNTSAISSNLQQMRQTQTSLMAEAERLRKQKQQIKNQYDQTLRQSQGLQQSIVQLDRQIQSLKQEIQLKTSVYNAPNSSAMITTITNPNQRYYQQLYYSCKAQNQQLRYQLSDRLQRDHTSIIQQKISILSNIDASHEPLREQNDRLSRNIQQLTTNQEIMENERARFLNSLNKTIQQKNQIFKANEYLEKEVQNYKLQIQATQSQQVQDGRRVSHVVIKANTSSINIQELQKEVIRLNSVIGDMKTKHNNELASIKTEYVKNANDFNRIDTLSREKAQVEDQNRKLNNQLSMLLTKQNQMSSDSLNNSNQIRWLKSDNQNTNGRQAVLKREIQESEIRYRKLSDNHRMQIESLSQSIRRLTSQNSSFEAKIRELELGMSSSFSQSQAYSQSYKYQSYQVQIGQPNQPQLQPQLQTQNRREDLLMQQLQTRKKSQLYLVQKSKTLQMNYSKLSVFVKQLQNKHNQQALQIQKLRSQNIRFQRSPSNVQNHGDTEYVNQLQEKFSEMLEEKAASIEKLEMLEGVLYNKEMKILRMFDFKENVLKDLMSEIRRAQTEVAKNGDKTRSDRLVSRLLQELVSKLEGQLVYTMKQKTQDAYVEMDESKKKRYSNGSGASDKGSDVVENVGIIMHNLLVFLSEQKWLQDIDFQIPRESQKYYEDVQRFLIELFFKVFEKKNEALDRQANQLLILRQKMQDLIDQQIQQIQEGGEQDFRISDFSVDQTKRKASIIALQHLFKLYLKTKSPQLLREILQLLNISEDD